MHSIAIELTHLFEKAIGYILAQTPPLEYYQLESPFHHPTPFILPFQHYFPSLFLQAPSFSIKQLNLLTCLLQLQEPHSCVAKKQTPCLKSFVVEQAQYLIVLKDNYFGSHRQVGSCPSLTERLIIMVKVRKQKYGYLNEQMSQFISSTINNNLTNRFVMATKEVCTYQQLFEFISLNGAVAVADFYTTWCGPCKLVAATIDTLRQEFNVSVARIDTDKAEELGNRFEVHSIPTYILFKKTGSDIIAVQTLVSTHTEKLRKLFEAALKLRNSGP